MREYKFRAWIPEVVDIKTNSFVENTKNKMVYSGELFYELSRFWGMLNANSIIVNGLYVPYPSPVMISTQIEDEERKEIFQGDIIRHSYSNKYYEIFILKYGEYDNGMSYEDEESGLGFYLYNIADDCIEGFLKNKLKDFCNHTVIGNIYENPELIGDKNETI